MVPEFKNLVEFIEFLEHNHLDKHDLLETLKTIAAKKSSRSSKALKVTIPVEDMTDEQLKREIINAGSVLYKAKQRGASEETIANNQARLDAAKAEKANRTPEVEEEPTTEEVYIEELTEEI